MFQVHVPSGVGVQVSPGALSELVHRLTHSVIGWLAIPQGRLDLFVPHQLHDLSRVCHFTEPRSEAVPQAVPDVVLVKARLLADLFKGPVQLILVRPVASEQSCLLV